MKKERTLVDYFERYKFDPTIVSKSRSWFEGQVNLLRRQRINPGLYLRQSGIKKNIIIPGNLYMYFYDPKHKDTLPHYDVFPLVFPFSKTENGFIGLNMHYLTYRLRIGLLDQLMRFKTTKGITDQTRLKYSYDMLKGLSKFPLAEHCVKQYLTEHIASEIKMVPPNDWTTAMMLPVEGFVKRTSTTVWKNTGGIK